MNRRSKAEATANAVQPADEVRPKPEPLRVVKRTLTRPDGSSVVVDVPVYPPFRLEAAESESAPDEEQRPASNRSDRTRKPPRDR